MIKNTKQFNQNQQIKKISYIDSKNEGIIHDLQYDYYGKRLATCSQDGMITIYDTQTPENIKKITQFQANEGPIWRICWAHPKFGDLLGSCSFDRKVSVWQQIKINEWQEINSHTEHLSSVNFVQFASWEMGLKLASCSSDGTVAILSKRGDDTWDKSYKFEAHEQGVNSLSWGPFTDCKLANSFKNTQKPLQRLATVSCDQKMKIWFYDYEKKIFECQLTIDAHKNWIRDVDWLSNCFGNSYDLIATCSEDQTVIIWKLQLQDFNFQKAQNFNPINYSEYFVHTFDGPAWKVQWSHTGCLLAVSVAAQKSDNTIYVFQEYDNHKWKIIQQIEHDVEN